MTEKDILRIISEDQWMMDILKTVRDLKLPDAMIGAGFVRNKVWDHLHGYKDRTPLDDIDVIYFDRTDVSEDTETKLQEKLSEEMPGPRWSLNNQVRLHVDNGDDPYTSSEDALSRWPETVTCLAVLLDENDKLVLVQPHGISDLINLEVRPSPTFRRKMDIYRDRIIKKNWQKKWPKLVIHEL